MSWNGITTQGHFQIMSNLHIEITKEYPDISDYIVPSADVLILAGVSRSPSDQLKTFLTNI